MWSNDGLDAKSVEKFLRELKAEQLECSEKGDYLWDFSGFLDKSSRVNSTDLGPQNSKNPLSSSPSSSSAIIPPSSTTTSPSTSSPGGALTSRQSMQRSVNLSESSRAKFVCVTDNFRANEKLSYEQDKDKDIDVNEKDILVSDGHKVRNSHTNIYFF